MEVDANTVKVWLNEGAPRDPYYQTAPERKDVMRDVQCMDHAFGQMPCLDQHGVLFIKHRGLNRGRLRESLVSSMAGSSPVMICPSF